MGSLDHPAVIQIIRLSACVSFYFIVSCMKVREICEVIGSGIQPLQNLSVLQKIGDEKMEWGHFYINKGFVGELTKVTIGFLLQLSCMLLTFIT